MLPVGPRVKAIATLGLSISVISMLAWTHIVHIIISDNKLEWIGRDMTGFEEVEYWDEVFKSQMCCPRFSSREKIILGEEIRGSDVLCPPCGHLVPTIWHSRFRHVVLHRACYAPGPPRYEWQRSFPRAVLPSSRSKWWIEVALMYQDLLGRRAGWRLQFLHVIFMLFLSI